MVCRVGGMVVDGCGRDRERIESMMERDALDLADMRFFA